MKSRILIIIGVFIFNFIASVSGVKGIKINDEESVMLQKERLLLVQMHGNQGPSGRGDKFDNIESKYNTGVKANTVMMSPTKVGVNPKVGSMILPNSFGGPFSPGKPTNSFNNVDMHANQFGRKSIPERSNNVYNTNIDAQKNSFGGSMGPIYPNPGMSGNNLGVPVVPLRPSSPILGGRQLQHENNRLPSPSSSFLTLNPSSCSVSRTAQNDIFGCQCSGGSGLYNWQFSQLPFGWTANNNVLTAKSGSIKNNVVYGCKVRVSDRNTKQSIQKSLFFYLQNGKIQSAIDYPYDFNVNLLIPGASNFRGFKQNYNNQGRRSSSDGVINTNINNVRDMFNTVGGIGGGCGLVALRPYMYGSGGFYKGDSYNPYFNQLPSQSQVNSIISRGSASDIITLIVNIVRSNIDCKTSVSFLNNLLHDIRRKILDTSNQNTYSTLHDNYNTFMSIINNNRNGCFGKLYNDNDDLFQQDDNGRMQFQGKPNLINYVGKVYGSAASDLTPTNFTFTTNTNVTVDVNTTQLAQNNPNSNINVNVNVQVITVVDVNVISNQWSDAYGSPLSNPPAGNGQSFINNDFPIQLPGTTGQKSFRGKIKSIKGYNAQVYDDKGNNYTLYFGGSSVIQSVNKTLPQPGDNILWMGSPKPGGRLTDYNVDQCFCY